ncbi:hypothetical protein MWU57_05095 [Isoptericola sp. S6320L]|uniref:hypothetical protein n=1 Tax=Isoptericola sp. S6320L TaxID=2926411 RepID=UPI001FF5CF95|nr:hypothetical protein [Isoptericola sp. S6320L]MCK0116404.1 hypothetical protein [Isoptericola sp. S6320L]
MNTEDESFERLAAADPAADAEPRPGVLRAKVDALAGTPAQVPSSGTDELAGRRERRRAPWLVAAGVAGAVALGGGGYLLGAAGAEGGAPTASDEAASEVLPPITLGGARDGAESGGDSAASEAMEGQAATEDSAGASSSADISLPGWHDGRAVFSGSGLSDEPGTAAAYAYDAREVATEAGAARLAEALGVAGEPRWEWGSWQVGPRDGDGPSIWLSADGTAYFSYNDPAADPWRCAEEPVETQEREDAEGGADVIEPAPCAEPDRPEVSRQEATDQVRDLMEQVGVDPSGFAFDVPDDGGSEGARWVSATQVVDGQATGATWSATVSDDGIAWLDGFLAATAPLGDYPVVSPAEAVERLGDPRFGGSSWPVAYAQETERMLEESVEEDGGEPTPPPAPPSSGGDLPWPVSEVTITEARLGLTQHHDAGGAVLLLPAYELSDAAGNTWSVLAVAEEALDTTSS